MSITDELRDYAKCYSVAGSWEDEKLIAIADRIDAEHERVRAESIIDMTDESMAEHGWVRLPVDADGEPIHVGDEVTFLGHSTVDAIGKDGEVFIFADNWPDGVYAERACDLRHYHAPTLEDVLSDIADEAASLTASYHEDGMTGEEYMVAMQLLAMEYAHKVREVMGE